MIHSYTDFTQIHTDLYKDIQILFPYRLLQNIEYSSLGYKVGLFSLLYSSAGM